jgi:hypothetical protein
MHRISDDLEKKWDEDLSHNAMVNEWDCPLDL